MFNSVINFRRVTHFRLCLFETQVTLNTVLYRLHTINTHCTLSSSLYLLALQITHCTLHTTHCTLNTEHYTLHTARWTVFSTQSTLNTALYTLHSTHCTPVWMAKPMGISLGESKPIRGNLSLLCINKTKYKILSRIRVKSFYLCFKLSLRLLHFCNQPIWT